MDLVKRYIDNVKSLLPRDRREDIAEELADAIHSRIDERAAALGRTLKPVEIEAILREFGHPVMVAARYGPQGRLIGPELYPLWVWSLKLLLFIIVVSTLGRSVAAVVGAPDTDAALAGFSRVWSGLWVSAFSTVGVVTVVFAAMERFKFNPLSEWRARDLAQPVGFATVSGGGRVSQIFALPFNLAALALVALLPSCHDLLPRAWDPAVWLDALGVGLTPVWWTLWGLSVASAAIEVGLNLNRIFAPMALRAHTLWRIASAATGLASVLVALKAGSLFELSPGAGTAARALAASGQWEAWLRWSLIALGVVLVVNLMWQVARLVRLLR
jgi:hypothetical protein